MSCLQHWAIPGYPPWMIFLVLVLRHRSCKRHNYSASLNFTYQHIHRKVADGDHKASWLWTSWTDATGSILDLAATWSWAVLHMCKMAATLKPEGGVWTPRMEKPEVRKLKICSGICLSVKQGAWNYVYLGFDFWAFSRLNNPKSKNDEWFPGFLLSADIKIEISNPIFWCRVGT